MGPLHTVIKYYRGVFWLHGTASYDHPQLGCSMVGCPTAARLTTAVYVGLLRTRHSSRFIHANPKDGFA